MYQIYFPTDLYFGAGAFKELHKIKMPGKKALVVTTSGKSIKRFGYLAELEKQLKEQNVEFSLFDKILPNPTKDSIMEAASQAKAEDCDFVIGFGGGSPMDSAKVIALMATNPGDLWDYCVRGTGKGQTIQNPPLPIVCISTTAGTGSEADCSGMVNNTDTNEKFGIGDVSMFSTISVVDPELMVSVPPVQTSYQGLDAFFHCAEGYISKKANLFNEMFAITAIENVGKYLVKAYRDGSNLEAREHMAFANTLGGLVMTTGKLTSQHSLEHVMSAFHPDLPHGAGLILICRAYFGHFVRKGDESQKFINMARALGNPTADKPEDFLVVLDKLLDDCGVGQLKMSDFGITKEELPVFAHEAKKVFEQLFYNDPSLLSEEDCLKIYEESYQ